MRPPLLLGLVGVLLAATACTGEGGRPATAAPSPVPSSPAAASAVPSAPASPSGSPSPVATPVVPLGDGRLEVVPGSAPASGPGEPTPYVVEVEGGLGIDAQAFAAEVDRVLADPRSWGAEGRRALRRVGADAPDVAVRVALASPGTVDRLCAPLRTNGYFSCANGDRAVLNVERWLSGAPSYAGRLVPYRQYLVNHEVGHVLGHGHEPCPGPGAPAPVMQQQTKGLDGCVENAWPYP